MNYGDTIDWMFSRLPMYQRQGKKAYKKDLSNINLLASHLNHPHRKFKSIHVAGTNGKGSTCHMLASVFQEAGYKVGLYTSPHLRDFRERIRINGQMVSKQFVIGFIARNKEFLETHSLSFFEMTVGMAFDCFARRDVDIAIIEVGLGGRLDATNIVIPELSVITNIGLDHTEFLGDTLQLIASEKAGIIKQNVPVIIGESQPETSPVFNRIAAEKSTDIHYADKEDYEMPFQLELPGKYQIKNIRTVAFACQYLKKLNWKITNKNIRDGITHVVKNTEIQGRWQVLNDNPKVICDTAHNREGLLLVMEQLKREKFENLHIVFGVVKDKDINRFIHLLPKEAVYYFCKPDVPRGEDAHSLMQKFETEGYKGKAYHSVEKAYEDALKHADLDDLIYVGGSNFVVAEII